MNIIKRIIPNSIKLKIKFSLYQLLHIEFNKSGLPVEISARLNKSKKLNYIDIGANYGSFSTKILKEYQINKGVIIEPLLVHKEELEKRFGDKENFKIINAAVSDKNGEATFFINEEADFISSLLEIKHSCNELKELEISKPKQLKVPTITLNSIDNEFANETIDLIKIDVQGAEHLVLKSASEILKRTKLVYTEFSYKPLYEGSSTFYDLYNLMYSYNFMLVNVGNGFINQNGELLQGDATFANCLPC